MAEEVPSRISIRLDPQTREQVLAVMRASGMTCSQAVRLLIMVGAAREDQLEMSFKAAAFREVATRVCASIRSRNEAMLTSVLKDIEAPS